MPPLRRFAGFLFAAGLVLAGQEAPQPEAAAPLRLADSELPGHSFETGGLKLTVLQFRVRPSGAALAAAAAALVVAPPLATLPVGPPVDTIRLRIENTTGQYLDYDPLELVLVGPDGAQVAVGKELAKGGERLPARVVLAPRAFLEGTYQFTRHPRLPATLHFQRTLLAEITGPAAPDPAARTSRTTDH